MTASFDKVSDVYDSTFADLPDTYIDLLLRMCELQENDIAVDLGCGTGRLTLPIAIRSKARMIGVDISERMLSVARKADTNGLVDWRCVSVEDYPFPPNMHQLITSFESFHLFPDLEATVDRCGRSLALGGVLAIGWMFFEWEATVREPVIEAFAKQGLDWGEWSYQACHRLPEAVASFSYLSPVVERFVEKTASTSIDDIITVLLSVEKTLSLPDWRRASVREDLRCSLHRLFPSGVATGASSFHWAYSTRIE